MALIPAAFAAGCPPAGRTEASRRTAPPTRTPSWVASDPIHGGGNVGSRLSPRASPSPRPPAVLGHGMKPGVSLRADPCPSSGNCGVPEFHHRKSKPFPAATSIRGASSRATAGGSADDPAGRPPGVGRDGRRGHRGLLHRAQHGSSLASRRSSLASTVWSSVARASRGGVLDPGRRHRDGAASRRRRPRGLTRRSRVRVTIAGRVRPAGRLWLPPDRGATVPRARAPRGTNPGVGRRAPVFGRAIARDTPGRHASTRTPSRHVAGSSRAPDAAVG